MSRPIRMAILASHDGTNAQAVMDACRSGHIHGNVAVVISNNSTAGVLARALAEGIAARHLSSATHPDAAELDAAILGELVVNNVDLIVLAGYMRKVGAKTLAAFHDKILNVHPALLPRHGGHGMFGMRVHEAVLAAGDSVTGVSVHIVDEHYDHGAVIAQEELPVLPGDDAGTLAARVRAIEHRLLVDTIAQIARGEVALAPRPSTEQCSPE